MVDDNDLAGLDPYDLMATEAERIDRHFATLADSEWEQPSRCDGWTVRDVLAHLAASESYNRACLDGTVQAFMTQLGEKGATDLATANDLGIREYDGQSSDEVRATWRAASAANREDFRARDGGEVDSSVGAYPARWQAFHLAFELATHADDVGVPTTAAEERDRVDWQARFGRFALKEAKPGVVTEAHDGRTRVTGGGVDADLADADFVTALAARVPAGSRIDPATAAALSVTP
jgi:uncharacterized protein (TIGR03083 family)